MRRWERRVWTEERDVRGMREKGWGFVEDTVRGVGGVLVDMVIDGVVVRMSEGEEWRGREMWSGDESLSCCCRWIADWHRFVLVDPNGREHVALLRVVRGSGVWSCGFIACAELAANCNGHAWELDVCTGTSLPAGCDPTGGKTRTEGALLDRGAGIWICSLLQAYL